MNDPIVWQVGGVIVALLVAVQQLRKARDTIGDALWESESFRAKARAAIQTDPVVQQLTGRVKEISRQLNPANDSDLNWSDRK